MPTKITGVLERIIFFNEENHFTIAEFAPDSPQKRITILGILPNVQCGETLELDGIWQNSPQHGAQFKIQNFKSRLPSTVHGIRKYLGSGLVAGIGKTYANKIVDALGTDTFRVLSEESARLRDIPGIGKKRAAAIKTAWDEQRLFRELYIHLQTYGVTTNQCLKLIKKYGAETRQLVDKNPYRIARDIDGIGFKTADRIALNLGYANDAPPRLEAGLLYALETLRDEGHTAVPRDELVPYTAELLGTPEANLNARIDHLLDRRQLVEHAGNLLQLPQLDRDEQRIADALGRITRAPSGLPPVKIPAAIEWASAKTGMTLAPRQAAALQNALAHKATVITGGPGTGKTTILRALVAILKAKKVRVHLASPTGRAAQRLAESTGAAASTIHRLLKYDPAINDFASNQLAPLPTDFLIIDETSMLDTTLAASLFDAVPPKAHLLLVGDTDQLPSVGPGKVLKDIIASEILPTTCLEVIYRQTGQSQIVTTAHAINTGDSSIPPSVENPDKLPSDGDLVFIPTDNAETALKFIGQLATQILPCLHPRLDPIQDIQVLAPMHKGVTGVANLNQQLQSALNPPHQKNASAAVEFRARDKIIQLRNNYEKNLFNGDIGIITRMDFDGGLFAEFDKLPQHLEKTDLHDIALAYAISIHKSQGSEYPVVIIPLLKAHYLMLQRNLLYTAITRGKKRVVIVGDPVAYQMAVRNTETRMRQTHLLRKILDGAEG